MLKEDPREVLQPIMMLHMFQRFQDLLQVFLEEARGVGMEWPLLKPPMSIYHKHLETSDITQSKVKIKSLLKSEAWVFQN